MLYRILADAVVVLHLVFILFVVFGGALVWRWPRFAWLHLPAVCWGAVVELAQLPCPLTPLELSLRQLAGQAGYSGGFVEHYLVGLIYPVTLTAKMQLGLGAFVIVVNLFAYGLILRRWSRRRR